MTRPVPAGAAAAAADRALDVLVAANRWTLWRTLARGLAHQLANAAQMLALDPPPPRARHEALERVQLATARLAEVHRAVPPGPTLVGDVLDDVQAAQRLQAAFPSTELVLDVAAALPPVAMPAPDLAHALLALVTNAKEAAAPRTAVVRVLARSCAAGVELVVADDGPGLAPEHAADAFEPGTVPRDAAHLGLGLGVARRLAERAGGTLGYDSRAGFRLTVPAWRSPAR